MGPPGLPGPRGKPGAPGVPYTETDGRRLYRSKDGNRDSDIKDNVVANQLPTKSEDLVSKLDALSNKIANYKKQLGTRLRPARSCRDIHLSFPSMESGDYWVDPNEGCTDDALLVYCDFSKNATCVYPKKTKIFELGINSDQIEYMGSNNQMRFLRLLSNRAYQSLTYHCKNTGTWARSFKMMSFDEKELTPTVVSDDCLMNDDNWHMTQLKIDTKKKTKLPISNVKPYMSGQTKQGIQIEIGCVCFS